MSGDIPDDLIKISKAAKLADVNPSTVWRWMLRGRLRSWKVGGQRRVSRAELVALFEPAGVESPRPRPEAAGRVERELEEAGW